MTSPTSINGTVKEGFEPISEAFANNFAEHGEIGASFCVYQDGEKVVDLWGGSMDKARTKPWQESTLVNVWSTTKGMMALCIARLNDQGLLDNQRNVVDYWPEFGENGKQDVTVAQLFSHQAGLCGTIEPATEELLLNTEALAEVLAAQAPSWPIGSRSGYHALSIGPLGDALVERVTGKTVGEYFRDEIAGPLDIDFHIGLAPENDARVATIVHDGKPLNGGIEHHNEIQRMAMDNLPLVPEIANKPEWRRQGTPSAAGHGNARGIAKIYGALATNRSIDGAELVSKEKLDAATTIQIENEDLVIGLPICWGVGFAINKGLGVYGPNEESFGHHGWGGSFGFADPQKKLGVAYAMNFMREVDVAPDPRLVGLIGALYSVA